MTCRLSILAFSLAIAASAAPLTITVSGTGTGSLNGVAFTAASFTFTLSTDSSAVAKPPCCNTLDTPSGTPATFSVTGVASGSVTDTQAVFLSQTDGAIGLAHFNGSDVVDLANPALKTYNWTTSIGPLTGTPSYVGSCPGIYCTSFTTSVGSLQFSAITTVTFTAAVAPAASANITTIAGTGAYGFGGDGGPATSAMLSTPVFVATDPGGNIYIADQFNHRIRKVDLTGNITTVVGTGVAGFSGDGGLATSAQINTPTGIFIAPNGDMVIADVGNQRIRKVAPNGIITTVAGNGGAGYGGDGALATSATFHNAVRAVEDAAGNIYIADQSNHRVRKVTAATGIITTIAGNGAAAFNGDGPGVTISLNNPTALAVDTSGTVFFCDQFNQRIRKLTTNGQVTTIAGTGAAGYGGDGGQATGALLNYPGGMVVDTAGNLFFSDDVNYRVREITAGGVISTVAGNGMQSFSGDGGPALSAALNGQFGLAITPSGDLIIADSMNNRIRKVAALSPVTPQFTTASVTNAASFAQGGSAGALATVFGQHLSVNVNGILGAVGLPLPVSLGGASVTVNGVAAPLIAVVNAGGSEQINFQIPWEVANQSPVTVVVNNGLSSQQASVPLSLVKAGIFTVDGVNGAIQHADGTLVTAANPAQNGEIVVVYATGLGPVSPSLVTGHPTPGSPNTLTTMTPVVTVGGLPTVVQFSGEASGFVGLNQVNVQLPTGLSSGPQSMTISVSGLTGNTVKIAIQ